MEVCDAGELYDIIEYFRPGALHNWEAMGGHELYQTVALQGRCTGLVTVASEQPGTLLRVRVVCALFIQTVAHEAIFATVVQPCAL